MLQDYTDIRYIRRLRSRNKYKAIEELAAVFSDSPVCTNTEELVDALIEREEIMSTGIGFGLAIPHAKIKSVKEIAFAVGVSKNGINFDSLDGKPVHIVILVAAGERQHKDYLKLLSEIMSVLREESVRNAIINAKSLGEITGVFSKEPPK